MCLSYMYVEAIILQSPFILNIISGDECCPLSDISNLDFCIGEDQCVQMSDDDLETCLQFTYQEDDLETSGRVHAAKNNCSQPATSHKVNTR